MQKIFVLGLILLFLLLLKNPFSPNNVISNLEPSPDSVHYLNPLKSFFEGKGFVLSYQDRSYPTQVPPLYSLIIMPFYLLGGDIRSFYFANVILTFISVILFYKILTIIFENKIIISLLYLSFVLNFIVFFYPTSAMAENLLLTLYLCSIWLIIKPLSLKSFLGFIFLSIAFFATKYVAWVLSISLILIALIKIRSFNGNKRNLTLIFFSIFISVLIFIFIDLKGGLNVVNKINWGLSNLFSVFFSFFQSQPSGISIGYFSKEYFINNFFRLLAGIIGGPSTVAGANFIILPIVVGMTSIFAIFINLIFPKYRLLSFYFFLSILGTLYYISTFIITEARYLLEFIPAFLIIFGIFLERILNFFNKNNRKIYSFILLTFIIISITLNVIPPGISQIKSNFSDRNKAANYLAIQAMNDYTNTKTDRPLIISLLSPYQIDFFSNKRFDILPVSRMQHFVDSVDKVWGIDPKKDFMEIYGDYLKAGREIYVSSYLLGDETYYKYDLQRIKANFKLTLVYEGCNNKCDLLKLELKN